MTKPRWNVPIPFKKNQKNICNENLQCDEWRELNRGSIKTKAGKH